MTTWGGSVPQRYLDEAEREKAQYVRELKDYHQSEAYQIATAKIQDKKVKKGKVILMDIFRSAYIVLVLNEIM